jgi:outer membrane protein assembly factor BamB
MNNLNRKLRTILLIALVVILVSLGLAGCSGSVAKKGWAGVSAINDTLIFVNMSGRIYSVDGATNTVVGSPVKFEITSSGTLSCLPSSCGGASVTPIGSYASPTVNGEMAIIGGSDGRVRAYPYIDGQLRENIRWTYPPDTSLGYSIIGGLAVAGDKVFFASVDGTVYALNAAEGYKVWSTELGSKVWSAPVVDGDTVYVSGFDKNLYALNATDGTIKWQYQINGAMSATPIVDNGIVYVGGYDRTFYAISTTTHQLAWKFPAAGNTSNAPDNWFWTTPVLHNGLIYAANLDGKVYVLDAATGQLKRAVEFATGFQKPGISSSPVVVDDLVVIAVTDLTKSTTKLNSTTASKIFVIDTLAGRESELTGFKESINSPLFAHNGKVYVHTSIDNFFVVNPQNGATQSISLTASTSK